MSEPFLVFRVAARPQWLARALDSFRAARLKRQRRKIVNSIADCSLAREIAAGHPDLNRRAVFRREALRQECRLLREAMALGCVRAAIAALHPASTAAKLVGAERMEDRP